MYADRKWRSVLQRSLLQDFITAAAGRTAGQREIYDRRADSYHYASDEQGGKHCCYKNL